MTEGANVGALDPVNAAVVRNSFAAVLGEGTIWDAIAVSVALDSDDVVVSGSTHGVMALGNGVVTLESVNGVVALNAYTDGAVLVGVTVAWESVTCDPKSVPVVEFASAVVQVWVAGLLDFVAASSEACGPEVVVCGATAEDSSVVSKSLGDV